MKTRQLLNRLRWLFLFFLSMPVWVVAQNGNQPYIRFTLTTGGDDLRNGQNVTISLFPTPEMGSYPQFRDVNMNQGRGSGNNSSFYYDFPLGNGWKPSNFRAFKILHDGSGHSPFEGYDNWNLDRIHVLFVDPSGYPKQTIMLDQSGQPLVRFAGDKRGHSWTFSPSTTGSGLPNGTGAGVKKPMSDSMIATIIRLGYSSVDDPLIIMQSKVKQQGATQTMTVEQVRRLMQAFKTDRDKYHIAGTCFEFVSDRQNFSSLTDELADVKYRDGFLRIANRLQTN
ncbi:DUF4476 domain-containing protein [Larkinella punicea]|uniref:DUF4476 domain-containing protein n=1 Tax=Larkinella punicea TaxID=2315727 RepID=A0A368JF58_9BACT|nr:DUF4476 domain-containing protein [Larkinella punicea]RCR66309.1 DUF4476 domain-containing protein [Larkinella punicea]